MQLTCLISIKSLMKVERLPSPAFTWLNMLTFHGLRFYVRSPLSISPSEFYSFSKIEFTAQPPDRHADSSHFDCGPTNLPDIVDPLCKYQTFQVPGGDTSNKGLPVQIFTERKGTFFLDFPRVAW